MIVVFLHGPAAAGKLTIGSGLSQLTGLPLFHNHLTVDLVHSLFAFGSDSFVRLRAIIWVEAFAEAADQGRSFIFTFAPESSMDPALIGQLIEVVERAGGKVHFVELQCAREGGFDFPPLPPALVTIDTATTSAAAGHVRPFP